MATSKPRKFISRTSCKAEKSHRTFAAHLNRKQEKLSGKEEKILNFSRFKVAKLIKIVTFALPKQTGLTKK